MNHFPKELAKLKSWMFLLLSLSGMTGLAATPLLFVSFTTPVLAQTQSERQEEAERLLDLCREYLEKEQFESALESCQQALSSYQEIKDSLGEASALLRLGAAYFFLEQFQQGSEFLQQALTIAQEIGETELATGIKQILLSSLRKIEADRLLEQGNRQLDISQYREALQSWQKALEIYQEIRDRIGEADSLNSLGLTYSNLGEYGKAIDFYQQSLAITQEIGDREGEGSVLSNLGYLYEQQEQPELAIVFYKQSVIIREGIRQGIQVLERQLQESYTETVAGTYRSLADLLLSQDRIYEAQQVLELLKLQEIQDFTRSKKIEVESSKVILLPEEERITKSYGQLVIFAQQLNECKRTQCSNLSQLYDELDKLENELEQLISELETLIGHRNIDDKQFLSPDLFNITANQIIEASDQYNSKPGTAIIYPLVLQDKLWLLWAVKGRVIGKLKIDNVGRLKLNNEVEKLRSALKKPNDSDLPSLQASARQLHEWLIEPVEKKLSAEGIEINHLAFSLDRGLRYIPMEVLFDGKEYLIEKYTITTFISKALTDTVDRLPRELNKTTVLGLGAANAPGYPPLKYVPVEINNIVQQNNSEDKQGIYPGLELLDDKFTYSSLRNNLSSRKILHIATHGKFVPGSQNASYLVLGNGEKLRIDGEQSIKTLKNYLDDVHLVVLSGCETAVGEATQRIKTQATDPNTRGNIEFEEGVEINALSYYFISGGVKTVMASLWRVDDASTSELMQRFYCTLADEKRSHTKAEALRKAKLSLLKKTSIDCEQSTTSNNTDFSHPYYWSSFILIGNGL